MSSLSDTMLSASCAPLLENIHGETITVLTGLDAGKKFNAINEIETDVFLESDLIKDPRGKRVLRFRDVAGNVPRLTKLDRLQTADGRKWTATRRPLSAYLTVDFELVGLSNDN